MIVRCVISSKEHQIRPQTVDLGHQTTQIVVRIPESIVNVREIDDLEMIRVPGKIIRTEHHPIRLQQAGLQKRISDEDHDEYDRQYPDEANSFVLFLMAAPAGRRGRSDRPGQGRDMLSPIDIHGIIPPFPRIV